jgi:hypothetical protein
MHIDGNYSLCVICPRSQRIAALPNEDNMNAIVFPSQPSERNSKIVALILKHLYEAAKPVEYTALPSSVREDTGLTEVQVSGTITSACFGLIAGGMVKCSWHDEKRNRTSLGLGAMLGLSRQMERLMSQTDGVEADPNEPYYGSEEIDELAKAAGDLSFDVLNHPAHYDSYLSFQVRPDDEITPENIAAAQELTRRFNDDQSVRDAIIDAQLSEGGCFVVATDCDLGFRSKVIPDDSV